MRLYKTDKTEYNAQKKQRDAAFRASAVKFEQRQVALADGTPIGMGLYATRPIAKGETILIEQSVLDTASLSNLYPEENLEHGIRHLLAKWIAPRTDADGSTTEDDRPEWLTDAKLDRWETLLSKHLREFKERRDVGRLPYVANYALQHLLARAGKNTDPRQHLKLLQKNAYNGKLFPTGSLVNGDEWRANVKFVTWDVIFPGENCGQKTANNPPFHIHNNRFGRMIAERDIVVGEELKSAYMLGGDVLEHAVEKLRASRTKTFMRNWIEADDAARLRREEDKLAGGPLVVEDERERAVREVLVQEADKKSTTFLGERIEVDTRRPAEAACVDVPEEDCPSPACRQSDCLQAEEGQSSARTEEELERRSSSPSSALSLSDAIAAVVKELVGVEKRQLLANWGIPFWSGYSQTDEDLAVSEVEAEVMRRIRREPSPPHTSRAPPP